MLGCNRISFQDESPRNMQYVIPQEDLSRTMVEKKYSSICSLINSVKDISRSSARETAFGAVETFSKQILLRVVI